MTRASRFTIPQLREIVFSTSDIIMDTQCPNDVIEKFIDLIYKEAVRLDRQDVLENLSKQELKG